MTKPSVDLTALVLADVKILSPTAVEPRVCLAVGASVAVKTPIPTEVPPKLVLAVDTFVRSDRLLVEISADPPPVLYAVTQADPLHAFIALEVELKYRSPVTRDELSGRVEGSDAYAP